MVYKLYFAARRRPRFSSINTTTPSAATSIYSSFTFPSACSSPHSLALHYKYKLLPHLLPPHSLIMATCQRCGYFNPPQVPVCQKCGGYVGRSLKMVSRKISQFLGQHSMDTRQTSPAGVTSV
ncbi:hypothetical protein BDD12DRAFT_88387 [Trichophaea hybrida]|nr:hypothetical protein BDD12DRAFT_88387 [Trichophaea hybrida]